MSSSTEPMEESASLAPSEIVAQKITASLVKAGLLDPARRYGFERALGQGKIKIEDLRFDIEQTSQR